MLRLFRRWLFCSMMALVLGCGSSAMPELAVIADVGPNVLEEGDVLWIEGEGFVEGPVELVLDGTFTPAGLASPSKKRVGLEASATGPSHIELLVTASTLARLSDEPVVFRGRIFARFPAAPGALLAVEAQSSEVTLELRPSGSAVKVAAQRARQAERYLETLGLSVSTDVQGSALVVVAVRPGSVAARAGVSQFDRLLGVDGSSLTDLSELGGIDVNAAHSFEIVSAAGEVRAVSMRLHSPLTLESDEMFALALAASLLGAFFVFAAPRRKAGLAGDSGPSSLPTALLACLPVALLPLIFDFDGDRPALVISLLGTAAIALCGYEFHSSASFGVRSARAVLRLVVLGGIALLAIWQGTSGVATLSTLAAKSPGTPALALSTPLHLAVLLVGLSLLYPSRHDKGALAGALRDLAAVPAATAMVVLFVPPAALGVSSDHAWSEPIALYLLTTVLLVIAAQGAPQATERRRRARPLVPTASRISALIAVYAGAMSVPRVGLSDDVKAMSVAVTTAMFFAVSSAAVLSAWRRRETHRAARRDETSEAMEAGTNPLISPP